MKLSQAEADKILYVASMDCKVNKCLRFGQALWYALPKDVADASNGTDIDFFYWEDKQKVLETFYKHYVEPYNATH